MQVVNQQVRFDLLTLEFFLDQSLIVDYFLLVDLLDELCLLLDDFLRMLIRAVFYLRRTFDVRLIFVDKDSQISLTVDHSYGVREFRRLLKDLSAECKHALHEFFNTELQILYSLMLLFLNSLQDRFVV